MPAVADTAGLTQFVVGLVLGSFGFTMRSDGPQQRPVGRVVLAGLVDDPDLAGALRRGLAIGGAGWRARTLATVPSNIKNPTRPGSTSTYATRRRWPPRGSAASSAWVRDQPPRPG